MSETNKWIKNAMIFPDSPRVIYKRNPLEQVICQLRFPTILRVDAELPADFQEKIRKEYPVLQEPDSSIPQEIRQFVPQELQQILGGAMPFQSLKHVYDFRSIDAQWITTLASDFLALTTKSYTRWEEFSSRLYRSLTALTEIYELDFVTRIGLRYRDVIRRSLLDVPAYTPWSELLKPHIAGELAFQDIALVTFEKHSHTLIQLENDLGYVRLQHGLAKDERDETVYLIDSDFFVEKVIEHDRVFEVLNEFNKYGRRLFSWCITEKLHHAMEPSDIT